MVLVTIILMDLLAGMEFDLFIPSFPELQAQFSLTPSLVEALLSINFIGYCFSLFLVGDLADRYGRKPMLLLGFTIFIIGSILCLSGISYTLLLVGRFLQGVGVAAPAILSFLIIADSYHLKKQQYWMAMLNGSQNTAVAFAPVIGSYITLYFHWQGNFIILSLLGLVTLVMTILFIPNDKRRYHEQTFSFAEYMPLFQSKPLRLLMANIIFMFIPYWIFAGMSPLLYMQGLGVPLSHFGYYQGTLALVFALGSVCFGLIMHRYKHKKMLHISSKIYIFSIISIAWVTAINSSHPLLITLAFLPFIISQIIPSALLVPVCLNFIPQAKGKVSAILHGAQLFLSAMSLQLSGHFYQGSFQNIGIIIIIFMLLVLITHVLVIKKREIIEYDRKN